LDTYFEYQNNPAFENGLLTYVNEASWGDMKELLLDVGISRGNTRFYNVGDLIKSNDNYLKSEDKMVRTLKNSRFTMLDMTDYETDFASFNDMQKVSFTNIGQMHN